MPVSHRDWISHHAARRPDATAAVDLASGRRLTYHAFNRRVGALARHLRDAFGVGSGARVAMLAHNGTDVIETQFACFRLGAIFVPLNWRLVIPELHAILADCSPTVLVHDPEFADVADGLARRLGVAHRLARGGDDSFYGRMLAATRPLEASYPATHDDPCLLLYTSGTTGAPKGAVSTHGTVFWNAANCTAAAGLSSDTVQLCVLPMFHTAGLNLYANPIIHLGGSVAVMRRFDPGDALHHLSDPVLGVTHFHGAPALYRAMTEHSGFAAADLSRLRTAFVGTAPVPVTLLDAWQARGVLLRQSYGLTEAGPLVLNLEAADATRKAGSAGMPVLHAEVRVVAGDGGRDAAPGTVGELWVRGPAVTPGYWNNPQATEAAFAEGSWLRSGDAVRADEDGFLFVVDRWKDMFVSGGENVYPAEVENVLYRHPGVAEAAVIGVPDERWGEDGRAVVVPKPGVAPSEAELLAHCAGELARYKIPRSVVFAEALPRSAVGKVHKPTLRDRFGTSA